MQIKNQYLNTESSKNDFIGILKSIELSMSYGQKCGVMLIKLLLKMTVCEILKFNLVFFHELDVNLIN